MATERNLRGRGSGAKIYRKSRRRCRRGAACDLPSEACLDRHDASHGDRAPAVVGAGDSDRDSEAGAEARVGERLARPGRPRATTPVAEQERVGRRGGELLEMVRRHDDGERRVVVREARERSEQESPGRGGRARRPARRGAAGGARHERPGDQGALALAVRAVAEAPLGQPAEAERRRAACRRGRRRASRAAPRSSRSSRSLPSGRPRDGQERREAIAVARVDEADPLRAARRRRCGRASRRGSRPCRCSGSRPRPRA